MVFTWLRLWGEITDRHFSVPCKKKTPNIYGWATYVSTSNGGECEMGLLIGFHDFT